MNKKNIDYEKENSIIEKFAYQIKFTKSPNVDELKNEIMRHIFIVKGLSSYVEFGDDIVGHTLVENKADRNYSGLVLASTYKDVMNIYGMKDQATGTIIPFMKLFNNLWNLRKSKIIKEKIEEKDYFNAKAKEEAMRTFLKKSIKLRKEDKRFNVLNLDKVTQILEERNCAPVVMEEAKFIMANSIVNADALASADNSDEIEGWQSDSTAVVNYEASSLAVNAIVDGIEQALSATQSPVIKKYILIHANMQFVNFVPTVGDTSYTQLAKYADPKLLSYLFHASNDDEIQVIADYLELERETVRKNLKKARLALAEAA